MYVGYADFDPADEVVRQIHHLKMMFLLFLIAPSPYIYISMGVFLFFLFFCFFSLLFLQVEHFYVGRGEACQDKAWLNANNIKRIVNAADDIPNFFDRDKTFSYQNLNLSDTMSTNQLVKAFQAAGKFAVPALKAKINVLVHCSRHSDRSVAVVR